MDARPLLVSTNRFRSDKKIKEIKDAQQRNLSALPVFKEWMRVEKAIINANGIRPATVLKNVDDREVRQSIMAAAFLPL